MGEKLGQHFLINPDVAENIISILSPGAADSVLEIGPGRGFLTSYLVETGARVTGIEIDADLTGFLKKKFKEENLKILNEDFLETDLNEFDFDKICGNIPYQISGKIIEKIVLAGLNWNTCVLMLPEAVARRVVAVPGSSGYSFISVMCGANCRTKIEFLVDRDEYAPPPKIDSAVVSLTRTAPPLPGTFYKFARAAFSNRRKNIKNSLSIYFAKPAYEINEILKSCNISPESRAQELKIEQFKELTKQFVSKQIL